MGIERRLTLVTGGAGFIGSHLVDRLLAEGNRVVAIDNFSTGTRKNLEQHSGNSALRVIDADIVDYDAIAPHFLGVDAVFHLATQNVRLSLRQPTAVHACNTTGTLNVLKAAAAVGVDRLLYCSSSEVNGTADVVPMPEDYPFKPETIYGASKLAGEYYAQVFHRAGWLKTTIARPHNSYGPREHYQGFKGEVIPRFILWALAGEPLRIFGDGAQTRDFTYVEETAQFLSELLAVDAALGGVFNVCRGQEVSIVDVARLVVELTGSSSRIEHLSRRPHDVLRLFGDTTKLNRLLGRKPAVDLRDGMEKTIRWFKRYVGTGPEVMAQLDRNNWEEQPAEPWLAALAGKSMTRSSA